MSGKLTGNVRGFLHKKSKTCPRNVQGMFGEMSKIAVEKIQKVVGKRSGTSGFFLYWPLDSNRADFGKFPCIFHDQKSATCVPPPYELMLT